MIQQIQYDTDEIQKFLDATKNSKLNEYNQTMQKLLSVQSRIPIISDIDPTELHQIIKKLKFMQYSFKDFIIKEGDVSQEIFFILSGECHVFVGNKKVGAIPTGSTFGEAAAVFSTKRNASVVCSSDKMTALSFGINHDNMDFCAPALASLYKNLALQINTKLEAMNQSLTKK